MSDDKGKRSASALSGIHIKMEGQEGAETITDIQNYLETFNKEIEGNDQAVQHVTEVQQVVTEDGTEEGTYFVDQSGHYYYQASSDQQPVMTVVSGIADPSSEVLDGASEATYVAMQPQDGHQVEEGIAAIDHSDEGVAGAADTSGMILNASDAYQTVTIVPSDTNPGEVSYVLIVQQPDDKDDKGEDQDLTVYDFDEGEEGGITMESGDEDDKTKIIKILPKKSQTVTQAHMCNYCNYTSPKRYLLSRHMKSHSEERPHKCSVCERGFKTLASLQNHVNTHTGTKPHRCKFCDSAFTTSGELVRHVRYKHTHEKPHKCTICDYASVELSKMRNHMRCHTGERPYQCPHCTYASPDTFKLKRHLRIHTGEKPYECDICHARFTQSNSLKAHKLIHSAGDKPVFQCELCPTTCGRKTDLRIHVQKLHTSDKPLKCKRCGKSFPDRYTYKIHNKSHEGEKCFKCDLCPYASISQRHLESHMLIHTDQKPYQCDQCDQIIDGQQVEVMAGQDEDDEDEDTDGEMMAVEGQDGQQYVVLEVIQLQDGDGGEQAVAVVTGDPSHTIGHNVSSLQEESEDENLLGELTDDENVMNSLNERKISKKETIAIRKRLQTQKDMQNCFGFDEDEDEETAKNTIQLLGTMP
ncbi:transcriptional repressor CTCFL isoform X5 [Anabrus simplex]|uniref:transcriptional repressor CTCFL isoform X5 n=1 Tax=Anabrus simplex TaxID=316456 RepID=UPI0034DD7DED